MRPFLIVCGVIFCLIIIVVVEVISKGCGTAGKMADQTIFNASKNVWSYDQFLKQYNQYLQLGEAEARLAECQKDKTCSEQRRANLETEADGVRGMMRRIAADYNAMSQSCYQSIWKSKKLPDRLGD